MRFSRLILLLAALLFAVAPAARAADDPGTDLSAALGSSPEDIVKKELEEGGAPGDKKQFTIKTDNNIAAMAVNDLYQSESKALFRVISVSANGNTGGSFTIERVGGTTDPGQRFQRRQGSGPLTVVARMTLLDLYVQGGAFLHPIAILGVATIILMLNSLWIYRRTRQIPDGFVEEADKALKRGDIKKFQNLAASERGLLPFVCRAMADRFHSSSEEDIKERASVAAASMINRLRIPVKTMNLIAAAAPLLGLLGTIVGMVIVFEAVAGETGAAKAAALAAGIRVKLFCTAFALMVAIPALFGFFGFNQKLSNIIADTEMVVERFIHRLMVLKRGGGAQAAADEEDEEEAEEEEAQEEADEEAVAEVEEEVEQPRPRTKRVARSDA